MLIISSSQQHQSGVVMVIGLIMLLLLTLIGLTASQVTGLEEKMAGNNRDQNIAFQAAEAALRDGEAMIGDPDTGIVSLSYFSTSNQGMYGEDDAHPDFHASTSWTSANSVAYTASMPLVHAQPRYYIKYIGTDDSNNNASINIGVYGESSAGATVSRFTVTARGTGRQDNSQVFLQSHYAKKF